jgi:hypothetical protein
MHCSVHPDMEMAPVERRLAPEGVVEMGWCCKRCLADGLDTWFVVEREKSLDPLQNEPKCSIIDRESGEKSRNRPWQRC